MPITRTTNVNVRVVHVDTKTGRVTLDVEADGRGKQFRLYSGDELGFGFRLRVDDPVLEVDL